MKQTTLRIDSITMSNTDGQGLTITPANVEKGFTKAEMLSALDRFHKIYGPHEGVVAWFRRWRPKWI